MKRESWFLFFLFFLSVGHWGNAQEKYDSTWQSLKIYQAPEWYEDAKLGFWPIWGVYSVPAFKGDHAAEWYGRWMYSQKDQSSRNNQGLATHLHHCRVYGPPEKFGYKDFIPLFTAQNFNATEWVRLCKEGGAKYFCTLAVFHDSFCMWNSPSTQWNSVNMGPHRDVVGELAEACRQEGLKFGVSNHSAWNYCFFQWNHINRYDAVDPAYQDLYGNPIVQPCADTVRIFQGEQRDTWIPRSRGLVKPSERDMDRWLERTEELADKYKPDLYYFDWGFNPPEWESRRKEFGAFYYNNAIEAGKGSYGEPNVVLNYKGGRTFEPGSAVRDFEHGAFEDIHDMVWQTDESVYLGNNWGFAEGVEIKPTNMIVDQFIDVISKRGVLMLAIAPRADGTFPDDQKKLLHELGHWLKICGEAVYSTRPYQVFGELGDKWMARDEHGHKKYLTTREDIRFTRNKDNNVLYAIALEWPGKTMIIKTLAHANLNQLQAIKLVGTSKKLKWKQTGKGLEVTMPNKPDYDFAYPLRLVFKDQLPSVK